MFGVYDLIKPKHQSHSDNSLIHLRLEVNHSTILNRDRREIWRVSPSVNPPATLIQAKCEARNSIRTTLSTVTAASDFERIPDRKRGSDKSRDERRFESNTIGYQNSRRSPFFDSNTLSFTTAISGCIPAGISERHDASGDTNKLCSTLETHTHTHIRKNKSLDTTQVGTVIDSIFNLVSARFI